jgi:hypothetical protein
MRRTVSSPPRRTRREALRTLTAAGVVTASAALLTGHGAEALAATPALLPHPGALIMIIRHGEKPSDSDGSPGMDGTGKHDPHSLTTRGWTRARALVQLFAPVAGAAGPRMTRPTAIYASGGDGGEGRRTRQTVTPLAAYLRVPVDTSFSKGHESALARHVASRTEPTLICWQHGELPAIAGALATVTPAPPTSWPDDRFDLIWALAPTGAGWSFHQIPELLLQGDSNRSIA